MSLQELLHQILDKINVEEGQILEQIMSAFTKEQLPYKLVVHMIKNLNGNFNGVSLTHWDPKQDVLVSRQWKDMVIYCYALHI